MIHSRRYRILGIVLTAVLVFAACPALYTFSVLAMVRKGGVFKTPQEGVITNAHRWYCGVEKVEIDHASTNSFDGSDPHVWYVIYRVFAQSHAPCNAANPGAPLFHQTFERGGQFYLSSKDGWVMVPEGFFPETLGFWMIVFGQAGPGDPRHVERGY